jgi:alcohol dehydrogenase class IV
MAECFGLKEKSGSAVVQNLFELNEGLGIPLRLRGAGVKEQHLEELADLAFADFAHPNNPKPVTRADFRALYQEAL